MPATGQRAGGDAPNRFMDRIDAEEGALRLEEFRRQRLDGDFYFEFELEFKPRRAPTVRYQGSMWGSWNDLGPVTRFKVVARDQTVLGQEDDAVELIIQNGAHPQAWIRRSQSESFREIKDAEIFQPLLPGLLYSPFDLQMPFIYWDDFIYEGPTLVGASRVAQQFLMLPPEGSAIVQRGITGVRVGLDDTYNALWRIEVMNTDTVLSKFAVESFQKVQGQYIVKRITLTDYPSKDRATFEVEKAAVGLFLSRDVFDPRLAQDATPPMPEGIEEL